MHKIEVVKTKQTNHMQEHSKVTYVEIPEPPRKMRKQLTEKDSQAILVMPI
jgi:hypothetical protein